MKTQNQRYLQAITDKIISDYPEDISLLVLYGSFVNGNTHTNSDVDLFYVPKTERSQELCKTYLIQEIGYDVFPISWERLEKIAKLNEFLVPLLLGGKVLYANSIEDESRFIQLQKKASELLADPSYRTMIAKRRIDESTQRLGKMVLSTDPSFVLQEAICRIEECIDAVLLSKGVVHLNGIRHFSEDIRSVDDFPKELVMIFDKLLFESDIQMMRALVVEGFRIASDEITSSSASTNKLLDIEELTAFYQEGISTYHKIIAACDAKDSRWAYLATAHLQKEMMNVEEETPIGTLPLLDLHSNRSLPLLKQHVIDRWSDYRQKLSGLGCDVVGFKSVEEAISR